MQTTRVVLVLSLVAGLAACSKVESQRPGPGSSETQPGSASAASEGPR